MKTTKRHLIILITLQTMLVWGNVVLAQQWSELPGRNATTTISSGTYYYKVLPNSTNASDHFTTRGITIQNGATVYLDLNGHILRGNYGNDVGSGTSAGASGRVITIQNGGKLILSDSRPNISHKGSVENGCWVWRVATNGTAATELKGGIITAGLSSGGSGIYVAKSGTLTIKGGTIAGNKTSEGNGGAIYIADKGDGTGPACTIEKGSIVYNTAEESGGAIYLGDNRSLTLGYNNNSNYVTNITNNTSRGNYGGGIIVMHNCTLNAYYSNISYNSETDNDNTNEMGKGGGIMIAHGSTVTMKNCTISNNKANKAINSSSGGYGGGIYVQFTTNPTYVTLENCNISNNQAYFKGAGIGMTGSNGSLTLTNTTITNNTLVSTHADAAGAGINKTVNTTVSGTIKITGNKKNDAANNVFIENTDQKYVNIGSTGLSCGASIGITKTHSFSNDSNTGGYTQIAAGSATHCTNAFNDHFFFDDKNQYNVYAFSSAQSPYLTGQLYFIETWKKSANASGVSQSGDTYTVSTAAGLAYIAQQVNNGTSYSGKTIQLSADINLNGHYWDPIGENYTTACSSTTDHPFAGTFDGKGYVITNLKDALPYADMGLFGYATGTVKNTMVMSGTLSNSAASTMGGIVGRLNGGAVYNCASKVTLTGGSSTKVGGLVGQITSGSLKNSYAIGNRLAGSNVGTIENCYVRDVTTLVGTNTGSMNYCYGPTGTSVSGTNSTFTPATSTFLYRNLDEQVTAASGNSHIPTRNNKQLVETLNNWVGSSTTYAKWVRPTTATINGDYPVLCLSDYYAVAANSSTPDVLHYGTATGSTNNLLSTYTSSSDAICLYRSLANISDNTSSSAKLYIDPDVAVTQAGSNNAYVGVWLDNSAGTGGANPSQGGTDNIDWHLFSSALENLPLGFTYNTSGYTPGHGNTPPAVTFTTPKSGYFPTNLASYYSEWDFYSYSEPDYHWVNMKRNSDDHWHSDYDHWQIYYTNEDHFVSGRGYLVATAQDCFLQAYGTLKKGDGITHPLSYTAGIAYTTRDGFNVLGNPYQSYLDFDQFALTNSAIWEGGVTKSGYIVMDEDQGGYAYYAHGASANHYGANRYLHPHQGFIVMAGKTGLTATFNENMRSVSGTGSFREERLNYALVNLIVTEGNGSRDLCTVELGRPDKGGLVKAKGVKAGKGSIYCHYDDEDYAIVFTQPGISEVGIRFETPDDDAFTLTWDMENADFHYLHLIDNKTGSDIDCLTTSEYCFSASPDDYKSRFRLVFGYTGIEEPEAPEPVEGPTTFAFQMGDELVVNGEGTLQVVDMMGRVLQVTSLHDTQSRVALPNVSKGVYILRLNGRNGTKTQKMIIE